MRIPVRTGAEGRLGRVLVAQVTASARTSRLTLNFKGDASAFTLLLRGGHPNCSGHLAQDSGFGRHWLDTARKTLHSLSDFCLAQQARAKRARWTADLGSENRPRSCGRISGGSSTRARTELLASPTSSDAGDCG